MLHDPYYHAARAAEERLLAIASTNLKVRAIRLEMAARHNGLVEVSGYAALQTIEADEQQKAG